MTLHQGARILENILKREDDFYAISYKFILVLVPVLVPVSYIYLKIKRSIFKL